MSIVKIKDKMSSPVQTIKITDSIRDAAKIMDAKNIGSLLVIDEDGRTKIITERDVVKAVADGKEDDDLQAHAISPLITISEDAMLGDAAQLMLSRNIRRLAVINEAGQISGIISIRDITRAVHNSFLALFDA